MKTVVIASTLKDTVGNENMQKTHMQTHLFPDHVDSDIGGGGWGGGVGGGGGGVGGWWWGGGGGGLFK